MKSARAVRRSVTARVLGEVDYAEALALQERLVRARREGAAGDTLLILSHPHVITLGSSSDPAHVLVDEAERARLGVALHEVGRGGDVTYHGPGQLVAYPILDLKPDRRDLHRYLRDLEAVLIGTVRALGVEGTRSTHGTGVWTPRGEKLGAVGVRVSSGWITSHGVALNVSTDLSYFATVVPCGIADHGVTSVERELGRPVVQDEACQAFVEAFSEVFDADVIVA